MHGAKQRLGHGPGLATLPPSSLSFSVLDPPSDVLAHDPPEKPRIYEPEPLGQDLLGP